MIRRFYRKMSILMVMLMMFQILSPSVSALAAETTMLPPSNVTVQYLTPDDIKLSWTSVFGASGYNIYGIIDGQILPVGTTKTNSFSVNDLSEGAYQYVVTTLNGTDESGPGAPVDVNITYPDMAAPATLSKSIQNGNDIVLSWTSSQYAESYNVYEITADGNKLLTTTTGLTYKQVNVPAGTYNYAVTSVNSKYGESPLSTTIQVPVVYPTMTAPATFTFTKNTANDVTLRWGAVTYATGYKLYQVVDGEKVLKGTITGTSVVYYNVPAGDYTYEIHSYSDRFGESADGKQISMTVSSVNMLPPTSFAYSVRNVNDIVLTWVAATNANSYKIYQIIDGQRVLKSTVTGTSVVYSNMPAGDYTFEITSYSDKFGESEESSQVSLTLNAVTMLSPSNLTYKIQNGNDVVLSWAAATNATSYKVYQIIDGQKVLKSTVTTTAATYTNMPAGDYTFEIYSYSDRFGESLEGSSIAFTLDQIYMDAPANFTYKIQNGNDIVLTWDSVLYASKYKVYQIVNGEKVLKSTVTGTTVTFSNMPEGDYTYEVVSNSTRFGDSLTGSQVNFPLVHPTIEPPANFVQKIISATQFSLSWDTAMYASSYKVYQIVDGQKVLKSTVTSGTTVTYSNMAPGDYTYEIHTYSARFGESVEGTVLNMTLNGEVMQDPINPTYSITSGNDITLRWTGVPYAKSYKVYQMINGEKVLRTTVTTTSITYTNMPGGDYDFIIHSYSSLLGESPNGSEVSFALQLPTMQAPATLTSKVQNGNDVVLTWTSVPYAANYRVYELVDGQEVLKTTVAALTTTLSNVPSGEHTYVVRSYSTRFGESPEGAQIVVNLAQIFMLPPTNLSYSIANGNDITLRWTASTYATSYKIYQVVAGVKVLKSTVTTASATFTNMPADDYTYEIHAYSSRFGESLDGSEISFTLDPVTMLPPANLTKTIANGNDITLKWNASTYATSYKVYQVVAGVKVLKSTVTTTTVTYTNMPEGDYAYEVHSYSSRFGESPESSLINFNLVWPVVQAPVVKGDVFNANNITLSWPAVTWANEYRIYEVKDNVRQLVYKGNVLTYKIYNLTEEVHTYEVTAYSTRFGESAASNQVVEDIIYPTMQPPVATLTLTSTTSARISWGFVTYANGYNIYEIINDELVPVVKNVNNLSYTISNLTYKNHEYYVTSYSNSFGESEVSNKVIAKLIVDTEAPVTTANAPGSWTNQATVNVTLSATDNETGVANTYYALNGSGFVTGNSIVVDSEGISTIDFYSVDKVGNTEVAKTASVKIDKTAPVTKASQIPVWSKDPVTVTLSATDDLSGVAKTLYAIDGAGYTEGSNIIIPQGSHKVSYYSVDAAGNVEAAQTVEVKIDKTAPVTTASQIPDWSKDPVTVTLSASDDLSGVAKTVYAIDGSEYMAGTSFTVAEEGIHKVTYYSVDVAGNVEAAKTVEVKIDKTAPVTVASQVPEWSKEPITVTLKATDNLSGVAKTLYAVDGVNYQEGTSIVIPEGSHKVSYYSVDAAGNVEAAKIVEVKIDKTAPVTTASQIPDWSNEPVTVELKAVDDLSGVAKTLYAVDGSAYVEGTNIVITDEGTHKVSYYSVDIAGNVEVTKSATVKIDKAAPVTKASQIPLWSNAAVSITLSATDALSGVAKTLYAIDDAEYVEGTNVAITEEGVHKVTYYSIDLAGNIEGTQTLYVRIDKTAPFTKVSQVPEWSTQPVTVKLTPTDALSGVTKTLYSINGSSFTEGTSFIISEEGIHKVSYYSVDAAGNIEKVQTVYVKIDKTAPVVMMDLQGEYPLGTLLPLTYLAKDNLSGVVEEKMTITGPNDVIGQEVTNGSGYLLDKPGIYNIAVTVTDAAGLSTTLYKKFVVYLPANIEVTPKVIKGNSGIFTVRVNLPQGYSTQGFDLNTATLNGVKALNNNNGYYNQAKLGQFKFERAQFNWVPSEMTVTFRGYVDGHLVIGQTLVQVQK